MALIQCDFFSDVLGLSMTMNVILPQNTTRQIGMTGKSRGGKLPCLYLLHGMSDDQSIWLRRTSIERYVAGLGLAVVMPAVHKSRYCDLTTGDRYWEYISAEVPRLAREFFPLSTRREDNFVAGLSMGGYGAFKLALNCPAQYAAAASLSGALVTNWQTTDPARRKLLEICHGSKKKFKTSGDNLPYLAQKLNRTPGPKPRLYQCCGTEDFLYDANQKFRKLMGNLKFDYTYAESPGTHEWGYWDQQIQRVLAWLAIGKR
jgi:S-formylglutathione hydrolase FrmB